MLCCRYKFRYPGLLHLAFNHASVDGRGSYALAWLGDAALMMIVTEQMGVLYPGQERGDFSTLRSHAISRCAAASQSGQGVGSHAVDVLPCCSLHAVLLTSQVKLAKTLRAMQSDVLLCCSLPV